MPTPCDRDGLWMKAKAHLNRSFAAYDDGDFEQAALWAATALELLGKAALAKVSPLLVADPQDEGRSLLIAAGVSREFTRFKSIPAKAVFGRCARAFPPFSETDALRIAKERNEELHSALSPYTGINQDEWWQRYWASAVLLVDAQSESLEELVGASRLPQVEAYLAANRANVARRIETMVGRARHRYELAKSSHDSLLEIRAMIARSHFGGEYEEAAECPACANAGSLVGEYVEESEIKYEEGDPEPWELLTVLADAFECPECGLRIVGHEYLTAADLSTEFHSEREYEPEWDDYGND